jgi:hypothetical protein
MDNPFLLDYVRVRPFNWILCAIAAVLPIVLVAFLRSLNVDKHAIQIGLIVVLMIIVAVFAYKTEVKMQEEEIASERTTPRPSEYRPEKPSTDDEAVALAKGLRMALRQPGPGDYLIRKLRK